MSASAGALATIRLGVVLLMLAAAAALLELLAAQAPGTPLYIGLLPGPVGALRELCSVLGLTLLVAGLLLPRTGWSMPRALVVCLYAGALIGIGAQAYAALHGMFAVQLRDLHPQAL